MSETTMCFCGCGEPALFAARHVHRKLRTQEKIQNWELRDMGYETPCHYWLGGFAGQRNGGPGRYPKIFIRGVYLMAHRFIYESERGPIPDGMHLHHLCRVTQCVNPAHLTPMGAREHNSLKRK